eukprot:2829908-Lingulodinium_polyedra.AAC.2
MAAAVIARPALAASRMTPPWSGQRANSCSVEPSSCARGASAAAFGRHRPAGPTVACGGSHAAAPSRGAPWSHSAG